MNNAAGSLSITDLVADLKRKSSGEFAGPCPWCGGVDRFVVWPNSGKSGRFFCRRCSRKGDAIDLLRERGHSFRESSRIVGLGCDARPAPARRSQPVAFKQDIWKQAAFRFVEQSKERRPSSWFDILQSRHLSVETAIRFSIGWNDNDVYFPNAAWGIGEPGKLLVPAGLVIPIYRDEAVIGISIRCRDRQSRPKYWQVKGSSNSCLLLGAVGLPVVIVESPLDAFLIWQEASDLVSAISIGGTKKRLDSNAQGHIRSAARVYVSMDYDQQEGSKLGAGQAASVELVGQFPEAEYLPPAVGKDPCEMMAEGVSIRDWIQAYLPHSQVVYSLPASYGGTLEALLRQLAEYPHLVACPKTSPRWYWRYRTACATCIGHQDCLKDWPVASIIKNETPN